MSTILVPLDFSDATAPIVAEVRALARPLHAHVWLLHVEPPEPDFVGYGPGPQSVRENVAAEIKKNHERLHAERDALRAEGVETDSLLVQGPTVETILSEAERLKADLIVLGSHGHGALFDMLVGSVSDGVIRRSTRPVVVIPCRKRE